MASIDILLATYNGERYLRQQLHSLQAQTVGDWRLIVHDDGSTDGTMDILKAFAASDSRIKIVEDGIRFGKAQLNFMHLLKMADADYVMFCDQDDIWLDNKIELTYNELRKGDADVPSVCYCQLYYWVPSEGTKGLCGGYNSPRNLKEFLMQKGGVQGCAAIFNRAMLNLIKDFEGHVMMHDHLLEMAAHTFGKVYKVETPLMLYRQHSSNVTGNDELGMNRFQWILSKLRKENHVIGKNCHQAVADFYSAYKDRMDDEARKNYEVFLSLRDMNRLHRAVKAYLAGFKRDRSRGKLFLKNLMAPYSK